MKKESEIVMRIVVLVLCCLAIAVVAAESRIDRLPGAPKSVAVHFTFQEKVVSLREPVVVVFEVHNGLSQPITVTVGALVRQFFDFSLTTPRGQILRKEPFGGLVDIVTAGDGKIIVAPGADYKEQLVMNQWFPFAAQGTYTLTSTLTSDIETEDGSFQAEAQTAQLRVNPRDPARLNKICAELEAQAEAASTVEASQGPTRALSYVEDPIAVPYLARVLSAHTLSYEMAIAGLQRIGDDAATEVLLSALHDSYGDIEISASRALSQMEGRIANPRLRETVKQAIQRSSERARNEFIKTQIAYLDYRDPNLQETAIQTLVQMDQNALEQAESALQRLANDPTQPANVVAAAKAALQKLHPPNS
jgi:hypothetical protein